MLPFGTFTVGFVSQPLIAAWLVQASGGQSWPLAAYVVVMSLVSLGCVQMLAGTSRKNLEVHP